MRTKLLIFIFIFSSVVFCAWGAIRIVRAVNFEQECGGYLKRAANANTIELAKVEMSRAIEYIEKNDLTSGYTSLMWKTPDEDVGYWYSNLKASLDELDSIAPEATQLEKSNVLMKLRETLMESEGKRDRLTVPRGITVYPSNFSFFLWGFLSFVPPALLIIGVIIWDELYR